MASMPRRFPKGNQLGYPPATPVQGDVAGLQYAFNATVEGNPPGTDPTGGLFAYDNATLANVANIYIAYYDWLGNDQHLYIATWDQSSTRKNRGTIIIRDNVNSAKTWNIFRIVGSIVDHTTYKQIPVKYISATQLPYVGERLAIQFYRTGDVSVVYPDINIHGAELQAPAAGTVLADSGPIPSAQAGQWQFDCWVSTDDAKQDIAEIAHRNAANSADLELSTIEFGATSQTTRRAFFTMAANERIVARNKGAVSTGATIQFDLQGFFIPP